MAMTLRNGFCSAAARSRRCISFEPPGCRGWRRALGPSGWMRGISAFGTVAAVQRGRIIPADNLHEGVDIGGSSRAVIDVIGVLVHVGRKNRPSARERRRMVRSPLVHKALASG